MLDGWTDGRNHTIINFLVSCPQGTMFLKSVDASDKMKDANLLFQLLDEIVISVVEENVVQIITHNASNYVLVGKMLEAKYMTIFWTPCATHCIDLMLEDIGKHEWIKNTIEHAKCVTKYIYNHSCVLNLMRKNTRGRELVRPAITRFATHFLTLQSLISQAKKLKKYFQVMNGMNLGGLTNKMEKTPKIKFLITHFGKKQKDCENWRARCKVLRLVDGGKNGLCYPHFVDN
jgi:hypothetical protein